MNTRDDRRAVHWELEMCGGRWAGRRLCARCSSISENRGGGGGGCKGRMRVTRLIIHAARGLMPHSGVARGGYIHA